ncbi:MAG: hypothetical protein R3E01_05275 [Pirellulaceae bacterium]|nr:hypothetical protein [Planctomycetales bacterium]
MRNHEIWLRANRRPAIPFLLFSTLATVAAAVSALLGWESGSFALAGASIALIVLAAIAIATAYRIAMIPRMATDGHLLRLHVLLGRSIDVPLSCVEVFFQGQGPADLRIRDVKGVQTANIIVRIAERASDWQQRSTWHPYAHWCEGYVTIHGTWCEPVTAQLLTELNQRLVQAKRSLSSTPSATSTVSEATS